MYIVLRNGIERFGHDINIPDLCFGPYESIVIEGGFILAYIEDKACRKHHFVRCDTCLAHHFILCDEHAGVLYGTENENLNGVVYETVEIIQDIPDELTASRTPLQWKNGWE